MEFDTIHTINARDNIVMEVMAQLTGSDDVIRTDFFNRKNLLSDMLEHHDISYADLKPALTPSKKNDEVCFLFDWQEIESNCYGSEVFDVLLPLMDSEWTCSVMSGDLLASGKGALLIQDWLSQNGNMCIPEDKIRPETLYGVYFNNASNARITKVHTVLHSFPGYVGHCILTAPSYMKDILSCTFVHTFVKCKDAVLSDDPDIIDEVKREEGNYEFEKHGFRSFKVPNDHFMFLLSYKIERRVKWDHKFDDAVAAHSLGLKQFDFSNLEVLLREAKHNYLKEHHAESLDHAGLCDANSQFIADQIKAKLQNQYIYNLSRSMDGTTGKCCINLYLDNQNFSCSLKCTEGCDKFEVVTFY